jgi:hypothetical protein
MRSFFRHELKLARFPARSPLPIAALPSMSLILAAPFNRLRAGYGAAGEITSNDQTTWLTVRDSWFRPGA